MYFFPKNFDRDILTANVTIAILIASLIKFGNSDTIGISGTGMLDLKTNIDKKEDAVFTIIGMKFLSSVSIASIFNYS